MFSAKSKIILKKILKFVFTGFSIFFIGVLFFMTVHDLMKGESSINSEYCAKYGFLSSPGCW
jgi:hypothetical protein